MSLLDAAAVGTLPDQLDGRGNVQQNDDGKISNVMIVRRSTRAQAGLVNSEVCKTRDAMRAALAGTHFVGP
jgi:hypothetical protein